VSSAIGTSIPSHFAKEQDERSYIAWLPFKLGLRVFSVSLHLDKNPPKKARTTNNKLNLQMAPGQNRALKTAPSLLPQKVF